MNITPASKCFDNSRLSAYKRCPRSYFLRHVLHWSTGGSSDALVFGSSWHAGLDVLWKLGKQFKPVDLAALAYDGFMETWVENGYPAKLSMEQQADLGARTPGIAKEMYYNYAVARARQLAEADVLAIEQPFAVPIPFMFDTWYIGKLDKVIQWNVNKVILEHKSTTAYSIAHTFLPDWSDSWFSSAQVKGYEFGGGLYFDGLDGVWVDGALVHKKVHDGFKFIPVKHSTPLLLEWLEDTKNWILRVNKDTAEYLDKGKLDKGCFPKNEESCFGKFGRCQFLDICRHVVDPTQLDGPPPGYSEDKWEPFSVLGLDKLIQQTKENTSET